MANLRSTLGTVNGNQSNAVHLGAQSVPSRHRLGSKLGNNPRVGAGSEHPTRFSDDHASSDPRRSQGERASGPNLSGCPSITGRPRRLSQATQNAQVSRIVARLTIARWLEPGEADQSAPKATPTMLEAAAASDMLEAFPFAVEDETWNLFIIRGHADLALAQEA